MPKLFLPIHLILLILYSSKQFSDADKGGLERYFKSTYMVTQEKHSILIDNMPKSDLLYHHLYFLQSKINTLHTADPIWLELLTFQKNWT